MILDLHAHTRLSHDGFTEVNQLINSCKLRGVDAIAVTEHDRVCQLDSSLFKKAGIELIPGCEFTDNSGAHILGLFVHKSLPYGESTENILLHIRAEGGFSVMPHPWKPGSGFMALNGAPSLVELFDFIELINGGWRSRDKSVDIFRLANEFGLRMIASSDSHKACHVGLCCTRIVTDNFAFNAQDLLRHVNQDDIELLIDKSLLDKAYVHSTSVKTTRFYQFFLHLVPKFIRRSLKLFFYNFSPDRFARPAAFTKVDAIASPW